MTRFTVLLAAILTLATPAWALDLPTRKAGLWELKMEFQGRSLPMQGMKQCTDAASDALMTYNFGGSAEHNCSKRNISSSGNTITIDSVCGSNGAISTSHAVVTGDFNSAYTVEVTSKREGTSPNGQRVYGDSKMTITAKYIGPCAAGQHPGDMIMSNGMTMNVIDLQKRMKGGAVPPPAR